MNSFVALSMPGAMEWFFIFGLLAVTVLVIGSIVWLAIRSRK